MQRIVQLLDATVAALRVQVRQSNETATAIRETTAAALAQTARTIYQTLVIEQAVAAAGADNGGFVINAACLRLSGNATFGFDLYRYGANPKGASNSTTGRRSLLDSLGGAPATNATSRGALGSIAAVVGAAARRVLAVSAGGTTALRASSTGSSSSLRPWGASGYELPTADQFQQYYSSTPAGERPRCVDRLRRSQFPGALPLAALRARITPTSHAWLAFAGTWAGTAATAARCRRARPPA